MDKLTWDTLFEQSKGLYDVAMESWNHSSKLETMDGERVKTRSKAKHQVSEYIEIYHNRKRLHSTLGYLNPIAYKTKKVV